MLEAFKYFIKKYKLIIFLALAINIPIILICTIRTNYEIISKGDTVVFNSVVDVDIPAISVNAIFMSSTKFS